MPRKKSSRHPLRWGRWLAGFLLLPPALFGTVAFASRLGRFQLSDYVQLAFLTGGGVYLVMHLLLWKPVFMHVMGHELTHAFWAVLLGGRIKSFQVSQAGGQVILSKSNFLIALAPYFFPFYTALLFPIYFICAPQFRPLMAFFLGFTLAFHIALTLYSLREHQSDLHDSGLFFSLVFVYAMNLVVLVLILAAIAPAVVTPREFVLETWNQMTRLFTWIGQIISACGVLPARQ